MSNLADEEWRNIDSSYQVSNVGRVRSLRRYVRIGVNEREVGGLILKPYINSRTGYLQVRVSGRLKKNVHRLVAIAFCEGFASGLVVNHKDGNKVNNDSCNLEWVTASENCIHSYRDLGNKGSCAGKFSKNHAASKAISMENITTGEVENFDCALDAVRKYGFLKSCGISRSCNNRIKSHSGHRFSFA